ncbi:hypothetical protein TNCV_2361361 [Trichonephila clavipes]|nr:hypothetical protein TNCV_2361361 [Trichonephila clavipes]
MIIWEQPQLWLTDFLEFVQSSKNITDVDSNHENEMNNAASSCPHITRNEERHENLCKDLLPAPGNRSNETRDIERRIWQRQRREGSGNDRGEKGRNEERTGEQWREKRGRKDCGTMVCNLGSSEYIVFLMKCPMEDVQ